jgi:hypothetical protein
MKRFLTILNLTAAVAGLALASTQQLALGSTVRMFTLQTNDYVRVHDATGFDGVICYRAPDAVPVQSIECYVANRSGLAPGSYSGFMTPTSISIFHYDSAGKAHLVWHRAQGSSSAAGIDPIHQPTGGDGMLAKTTRMTASATSAARAAFGHGFDLQLGQGAIVAGTNIHLFNDSTAQPQGSIECYLHTASKSGIVAGSYAVMVNGGDISVWRYDAAGNPTRVYDHSEPRS